MGIDFRREVLPILEEHCFDCHGDGSAKGEVSFDEVESLEALVGNQELWAHVLKNIRSGLMPPARNDRIPAEELALLEQWVKRDALRLDPKNPDPGRVTLRRLNRVEYRDTIRDLLGVEYRTYEEFPADDTGYGFDTIGDVLSTSPMLLEKYMTAAEFIIAEAVPLHSHTSPRRLVEAHFFNGIGGRDGEYRELRVPIYDKLDLTAEVKIEKSGRYRVVLDSEVPKSYGYDPGVSDVEFFVGERSIATRELKWLDGMNFEHSEEIQLEAGTILFRLVNNPRSKYDEVSHDSNDGRTWIDLEFRGVTLIGPLEEEYAVPTAGYDRFFPRIEPPVDAGERLTYAREILEKFATRAFRRPVDEETLDRLVGFARTDGSHFEKGIARAMTAILASPRFLFRMEETLPESDPAAFPLLDEWALASRLSYFLWSTMPDEILLELARKGELRKNLPEQIERMVQDHRSDELVVNFVGQWLQTRDIEGVSIDARSVSARDMGGSKSLEKLKAEHDRIDGLIDDAVKANDADRETALREELREFYRKYRKAGPREFEWGIRNAMKREAEMLFAHLMRTNGSVLKLLSNTETFLNEELAKHYGVPGIQGGEMRLVTLPAGSPRGGVLTMGSILAVTSNPTRTSPVKRGLFILDNILGTPPPPPPPDIPSLESVERKPDGSERSLREALAIHREKPLCASCHNRMDPLGLALENFNALGQWRDAELGEPLASPAGILATGERFADVAELKELLVTARRDDYYRCLSEKLFTYALGRGPETCDIETIDQLVEKLRQSGGDFSTLISGIVQSSAFQKRQRQNP